MAQVMMCDAEGCTNAADVVLTRIDSGAVQALCDPCFADLVLSMAVAMTEAAGAQPEVEVGAGAAPRRRRKAASPEAAEGVPVDPQADPDTP